MALELLIVQAAELISAANQMNEAAEIYNDAVDAAKSAGEDLASKWEGAAKDAFVAQQQNAYNWHMQILEIVRQVIDILRRAIDKYNQMEQAVKNIVQG